MIQNSWSDSDNVYLIINLECCIEVSTVESTMDLHLIGSDRVETQRNFVPDERIRGEIKEQF